MAAYDEMMESVDKFASAFRWSKESYHPILIERLKKKTGLTEHELITNLMTILSEQNEERHKLIARLEESAFQREANNLTHQSEIKKMEVGIPKTRTINQILNDDRGKGRLSVEMVKRGEPIAKREDVTAEDIMLLKLEGLTHQEIADKLGISRATVERRLRERRERIAKGFGQ